LFESDLDAELRRLRGQLRYLWIATLFLGTVVVGGGLWALLGKADEIVTSRLVVKNKEGQSQAIISADDEEIRLTLLDSETRGIVDLSVTDGIPNIVIGNQAGGAIQLAGGTRSLHLKATGKYDVLYSYDPYISVVQSAPPVKSQIQLETGRKGPSIALHGDIGSAVVDVSGDAPEIKFFDMEGEREIDKVSPSQASCMHVKTIGISQESSAH